MALQKKKVSGIPCSYIVFVFAPAAGGNFYIQNRYAYNLFRLTIHTLLMLYAFSFLLPSYGLCLMCHQADADMVLSPFLAALLIFSRSICSCFFVMLYHLLYCFVKLLIYVCRFSFFPPGAVSTSHFTAHQFTSNHRGVWTGRFYEYGHCSHRLCVAAGLKFFFSHHSLLCTAPVAAARRLHSLPHPIFRSQFRTFR